MVVSNCSEQEYERTNLHEAVAGRKRHLVEVGRVPRAHDDPAIFGPVLDGVDYVGQLKNKV